MPKFKEDCITIHISSAVDKRLPFSEAKTLGKKGVSYTWENENTGYQVWFNSKSEQIFQTFAPKVSDSWRNSCRQDPHEEVADDLWPPQHLLELGGLVVVRERGWRNGQIQKIAQRLPPLLDVEDEELVSRNCLLNFFDPLVVELDGGLHPVLNWPKQTCKKCLLWK